MDACVQLFVSEIPRIEELRDVTKVAEWGGKRYRQDPTTYAFGECCTIVADRAPDWLLQRLPPEHRQEGLHSFLVQGAWMNQLQGLLRGWGSDEDPGAECSRRVLPLIEKILEASHRWGLAFLEQCEDYDEVVRTDVDGAVARLERSLTDDEYRGFVAFSGVDS
jgi:hypothetical protein